MCIFKYNTFQWLFRILSFAASTAIAEITHEFIDKNGN